MTSGSVPLKFPRNGGDTMEKIRAFPSASVPASVREAAVSPETANVREIANGAAFMADTVRVKVATRVVPAASPADYAELSVPLQLGSGVQVMAGALPLTVPCTGGTVIK
jgi:hypothetical protein